MIALLRASLLSFAVGAGFTGTFASDLQGRPIVHLAPSGTSAVVLFFTASDCPIANRYVPEMQRLATQLAPLGVRVWFVYPNPADTAQVVQTHNREFSIHADTALDTWQTLVRMGHVTATPEAAVFVPRAGGLQEVYRGRIDDRYVSLGTERPQAMHHDLEDAIHAVLAHQPVPGPGGPTVGCSIVPLQP
jgi:hypothetical protein